MRLAIIGNSLSAQEPLRKATWPTIASWNMPGVSVATFATDGNTAFRENNGGQLPRVYRFTPDVVIVGLNYNEVILNVDGRTPDQLMSDVSTLFTSLKSQIVGVKLLHMAELSGNLATISYTTFVNEVRMALPWDGTIEMNYEKCIAAASLITNVPLIDFIHPTYITASMQAAEITGQLISMFDLPVQIPQWSNVDAFVSSFKAGDPYAIAAKNSLTN